MLCLTSVNYIILLIWHHRVSEQTITVLAPETNVDAKALSEVPVSSDPVPKTSVLRKQKRPDTAVAPKKEHSMTDAMHKTYKVAPKMDIQNTKKTHELLLYMLTHFVRIAEKYNLDYWVCGGTLIGAIRHGGFIPWDADIDLGISEDSYNKLAGISKKEFPADMWLHNTASDKGFIWKDRAKIRDIHSDYADSNYDDHLGLHNGLQIDIYVNFKGENALSRGTSCCLNHGEAYPFRHIPFENITVNIPRSSEIVLRRYYNNIDVPGVAERIHHQGKVVFKAANWVKKKYPELYESNPNKPTVMLGMATRDRPGYVQLQPPTLYVLTTGVRHFQAPQAFTTTTVMGQKQTATVGPTFDEGYGPQQWPEGAKRVVDGHVTVWRKIAAECSDWCFVSEDDAIWPSGLPPPLPSEGFVSFFKEAVCLNSTASYSENYDRVVKAVVPAQCMPYGAVAYAITGDFAKMLLSNLPMSKPVEHFLWEQAVVKKKAYVSRRYVVQHKKGKSLRQTADKHAPPNATNPDTTRPNHIGIAVAIPTHNRARTIISEPVAIPTYKADEHALTPKYVVVMPSVKRNDDIYLKKTLASLEIAKPSEITVILVNGHQPPEHHSCLNDWCASHESYKCIVPPPVPDSLMQKVIRQDKRNDTNHFLRWRTRETEHALFGLKAAASMQTDYIIWIQDDVIVDLHLFDKLKEGDIYCLNDGPDYCGAVGYLFSQKKVQTLIPKIEQNKMSMPIDWIIYDPFDPTLQPLQTIPLVHHIGVKSSKSRPKIAVAIPTYNRAGYVQLCAAALSKTIPSNDVWIFDDHSTEYTVGDLKKWFHTENVQQNTERFKADKQARHILEWFVGTDYDWLITLDSDLIVRPDWLELLRGMLPRTQGVMSLYHSGNPNHPTLHCDPHLCEMKSLGNAGVAWSKVLAKRMLVEMTQSDGFDWGWTEWLRKQKIPQYAAKDSLVLHVGMHGTWGADSKREKSVGFPMDKLSPDVRGRAELFLKGMQ